MGVTPAVVRLPRRQSHVMRIELAGYERYEVTFTRHLSGWVLGNIPLVSVPGLIIDVATGAMYKLSPEVVDGRLVVRTARLDDGSTMQIAVVFGADPSWQKVGQLSPLR